MNEQTRLRIERAKRDLADQADVGESAGVSDEDLVWLARSITAGEAYIAEMGRRQIVASGKLKTALETTSDRLLWTTRLLGVYTAALLVVAVITAFCRS